MDRMTVVQTVQNNLCCGCGVCKGICPKGCISWKREGGLYLPLIDEGLCVNCGLCAKVCPGLGHTYASGETAMDAVTGTVLSCRNAWSVDPQLRHTGASGGVVSTMIRELLLTGQYDGAFCLDSYNYRNQLQTRLYTAEEAAACRGDSQTPKSRYLPVSHENAVLYLKKHRTERLIFVGTSCAVRGLQSAVRELGLDRDRYLFIGLFCDQVFTYNVLDYFRDTYASGKTLEALHFKNKESGGWPGDMKFFPEDGTPFYVPMAERAKAKAYFRPERCLYCVDKLNVCADISLGDNYTGKDSSPLGSNSVIIRTETGMAAWKAAAHTLEVRDIAMEDIQKAQYLEGRMNNLYFGDGKVDWNLNPGIPRDRDHREYRWAWKDALRKLRMGERYGEHPEKAGKKIHRDRKPVNPVRRFLRRCVRYAARKLK